MRSLLSALMFLALVLPLSAQPVGASDVLRGAVDGFIRPQTEAFAERSHALATALDTLCERPSASAMETARKSFGKAATSYGRVEFLRIGPLMEDNRADRILFWPDRRGIGLRQVQQILAESDASATSLEGLYAKSVAVQGFGALEFVLFGSDSGQLAYADGAFRCAYGRAIGQNLSQIAGHISAAWADPDGIAQRITKPSPEFADYRTETEALEMLVGLVSHGLESVRDTRITPFMSRGGGDAKPRQALFWRSGLTMAMIRANIEGLSRMTKASALADAIAEDSDGVGGSVAFEFRNALNAIDLVTLPVEQAVKDDAQSRTLNYLVIVTGSLQTLIGEKLSAALGLSVGFSSLDGD